MWAVVSRVILYIAVLITPLLVSTFQSPAEKDPFFVELATRFGLLGFIILAMQFVISARIKWIEKPFGLDEVFRFHKHMAIFAAALLTAHPLLLAIVSGHWALLTSFNLPWIIMFGKTALILIFIIAITSLFRLSIRLEFQKWRIIHNIAASLILIIGFIHSFKLSGDLEQAAVHAMLIAIFSFGMLAYLYDMLIMPILARRNAYTVTNVKQETPNVWTLEFAPPEGKYISDYLPGQFNFLTLYRKAGLPTEEHPFTISSSPTEKGYLSSTIKASGDYTSTISATKPGDKVALRGPFGHFSYVFKSDEKDLVFISGGIGITPLMSMLRYMHNTRADVEVQLLCFNRTHEDIAFRDELAEIENAGIIKLKVTYILDKPGSSWSGETGLPDQEKLKRLINGEIKTKSYYICGPPIMMELTKKVLLDLGVSKSKIYYEKFAL